MNKIKKRLNDFKSLPKSEYKKEFLFCLLTPQSNAQRCWQAVLELSKLKSFNIDNITKILSTRTRFHHTKAKRILNAEDNWKAITPLLDNTDSFQLRNQLAEKVNGYGLKEAGHFLRNIGKSNNQIAILDRHIMKNLNNKGIVEKIEIKSTKHYFEIERKFLDYAKSIGKKPDELDLLWWSKENGEIFK
jgi:N-glycosylase/DNA lyase